MYGNLGRARSGQVRGHLPRGAGEVGASRGGERARRLAVGVLDGLPRFHR